MEQWQKILKESIESSQEIQKRFNLTCAEERRLHKVILRYPMRVNSYYLNLIRKKNDAIWKQAIPDSAELTDENGCEDPLHEEIDSPVQGLTHRYPDRVLLLVSNSCAMYCRFCTRKRRVGYVNKNIDLAQIQKGIEYIANNKKVRDVIISGGDPLMLKDSTIEWILKKLREIPHVEIIRIGSRVPVTLPQRITPRLVKMLKKYHPLYLNTHFNHPAEITKESVHATNLLADAGIPIGNQTVLLKGVNDNAKTMKKLMQELLKIRIRPYYLYQADLAKGTSHFRTKVEKGIAIIKSLQGHTSGFAVPHYVIDAPGGGGKIPVNPNYVVTKNKKSIILRNYAGRTYRYPEPKK